jgi:hypothetical protein
MASKDLSPPSYADIRSGNTHATEDAIRNIFNALVAEISERSRGQTRAIDRFDKKVLEVAPTTNQNNFDYQKTGTVNFAGATAVNLTGLIAPERDGAIVVLHTTGSGTITVKHQDANSDAANRIISASGADRSLSTNKTLILQYLSGRWRDLSFQ